MTGAAIAIDGLAKAYGATQALEELDLQVPAGAHVGLLGPPGAGKTTLARLLAGLEAPTSGAVRVAQTDLATVSTPRARLGYVPERPGLDEHRTPRELLRQAGRLHGLATSEAERRLERLLIDVGLDHLGGYPIEHLATGMRRRLALAYTLVPDPPALVVDEPTRGLAPEATRRVREVVADLAEHRTLLVLASQPADVEALCERVVGLEAGRVVLEAGLEALAGEQGLAVDVELAGSLPQAALDAVREHAAVGALRREPADTGADLVLWITDPDELPAVLATLVDAGAPVESFARREPDLGELVAEHMEGPL